MSLQQIKPAKTLQNWLGDSWRVTRPADPCYCHLCKPPKKFSLEFVIQLSDSLNEMINKINEEVTISVTQVASQNNINMDMWWQEI